MIFLLWVGRGGYPWVMWRWQSLLPHPTPRPASGALPWHRCRQCHCHRLLRHHLARLHCILPTAPPTPSHRRRHRVRFEFQLRHHVSDQWSSPRLHVPQHAPLAPYHVIGGDEGGDRRRKAEGDIEQYFGGSGGGGCSRRRRCSHTQG